MKAFIEHESRGRLRVRMKQYRMTLEQADLLEAYLQNQPGVLNAAVHERTCCAPLLSQRRGLSVLPLSTGSWFFKAYLYLLYTTTGNSR